MIEEEQLNEPTEPTQMQIDGRFIKKLMLVLGECHYFVNRMSADKINVDLMKRNRELEARIERVRTVANTSGVRSEDMFDAVYSLLADAPQTETQP